VPTERRVRLFRNGRNQAVRIPRDLELPGNEALIHKEGERLIVEPAHRPSLLELLAQWDPLDVDFPGIDDLEPRSSPGPAGRSPLRGDPLASRAAGSADRAERSADRGASAGT
jgi:antitoxin VapB